MGRAAFLFGSGPDSCTTIYNDPILSKTNNIIVLVRVDPLHTWLESGEELLDKTGQLHLEINFILSKVLIDSGVRNHKLRGAMCIQHRHLWLFTVL